jgi:hypothetical protein
MIFKQMHLTLGEAPVIKVINWATDKGLEIFYIKANG